MSIRRIVQATVTAHTYRMQHIVVFSILPVRGHAHFHSSGLVIPNTLQYVIAALATMLRMRKKNIVSILKPDKIQTHAQPVLAGMSQRVLKPPVKTM